jgi:hypothetical protein
MREARLPTYRTAARVLEGHTGSGIRLIGWTIARTALIAPPMMLVGVPAKQAFYGAAVASALISSLTLLRIFNGRQSGLEGVKSYRPQSGVLRSRRRLAAARSSR